MRYGLHRKRRAHLLRTLPLALLIGLLAAPPSKASTLDVYVIDVEGGKAMLVVAPSGQSMLVDAGWAGLNDEKMQVFQGDGRDANRIAEVVELAGLKRLDYIVITHYHEDHVSNIGRTIERLGLPVGTFFDHGEPLTQNASELARYEQYISTIASLNGKRVIVKPGDLIAFQNVDVRVVSSAYRTIGRPVPGGGMPNPLCSEATPGRPGGGENAASVGLLYTFGKFRMLDLADLTTDREYDLMCPVNRIGPVDLWMMSHHGFSASNSALLIHAIAPRAVIINNGARKFGQAEPFDTVRNSPGIEDVWQLHYAVGVHNNTSEPLIANTETEPDPRCYGCVIGDKGHWIKVSARADGSFTIVNGRNKHAKTYRPRGADARGNGR